MQQLENLLERIIRRLNINLRGFDFDFRGSGARFVAAFQNRINHILEANGAYFDGAKSRGHAQTGQNVSYNIIQAYPIGPQQGIFPTIDIQP
jgi:hypothetical protein